MPSPASSTVPVSLTATFLSKPSISFRMIWLISSARICMAVFFRSLSGVSVDQSGAQVGELRTHAAVKHQVTDAGDHTSDELGVDRRMNDDLLARPLLQRSANAIQRGRDQLLRGGHLG